MFQSWGVREKVVGVLACTRAGCGYPHEWPQHGNLKGILLSPRLISLLENFQKPCHFPAILKDWKSFWQVQLFSAAISFSILLFGDGIPGKPSLQSELSYYIIFVRKPIMSAWKLHCWFIWKRLLSKGEIAFSILQNSNFRLMLFWCILVWTQDYIDAWIVFMWCICTFMLVCNELQELC